MHVVVVEKTDNLVIIEVYIRQAVTSARYIFANILNHMTNAASLKFFDDGQWIDNLPGTELIVLKDRITHVESTYLPLQGGTLTGNLESTGTIGTSHPDGIHVRNLTTNHHISIDYFNEIPLLRIGGAGAGEIPFEIQTTQDRLMMSLRPTRVEVPGGFIAGGNITAPRFVGNADTGSRLQNSRTITLTGAIAGSVNFDGSSNVTINTSFASKDLSKASAEEINLYKLKIDQL